MDLLQNETNAFLLIFFFEQCLDLIGKQGTQEEADQRHQRLESAKPAAADQTFPQTCFFYRQALAHRHRKGVHTDTYRQQKQRS